MVDCVVFVGVVYHVDSVVAVDFFVISIDSVVTGNCCPLLIIYLADNVITFDISGSAARAAVERNQSVGIH